MHSCDTILHAAILLTQNQAGEILEDASIAIIGERISAIGKRDEIAREWQAKREIDLGNSLLMPGLINAHTHASMTFLRGVADDKPLLEWLEQSVFPVEARITPEICRAGALLGYAEMISTGTTTCIDMYIFEEAVFEAAEIAGLRCMGGEAVFEFPSAACENYKIALQRTEKLAEHWQGHDRISVAVNPHSVYTTTPQILADCRDLARKLDLPLHLHLAETANESSLSLRRNGMRPVPYCESLGLFDGPVIAAHVVDVNQAEIKCLAQHDIVVAHCPTSNMKLASGLAPVEQMKAAGIQVGLGTDGPASNNQLNIFMEMRLAALAHKLATQDPTVLGAASVLNMATQGGANALGRQDIGSLDVGKMADIIALDLGRPNMMPMANPISQVVYSATGNECRFTMVSGEILYQDGHFTRFSKDDLREEANNLAKFASAKA